MGRKHSRNSHSSPFFSHHERNALSYGSKKQRLGAESYRKFDACMLCNSTVRSPCACPDGHIYCRECILEAILTQKKLIKAHELAVARRGEEEKAEQEKARQEARERVLADFEKSQSGLGARKPKAGSSSTAATAEGSAERDDAEEAGDRGQKRKFEFDMSELDQMATAAEDAALAEIEQEQELKRKNRKLPSFWLPSLTPQAGPAKVKEVKLETMCQASEHPHPLKLKNLIDVKFTPLPLSADSTTAGSSNPTASMCPSCSKELTNSAVSVLIKVCGHVVCKTCVDKIVKPGKQCVACDATVKEKDVVELQRDGTGYAAAGKAEAVKAGTAFQ